MFTAMNKNLILPMVVLIFAGFSAQANTTNKTDTTTGTSSGLSAMDQRHGTQQDEDITRKIRERIMSIQDLSTSAQNVRIITLDRKVSLIGEVATQQEKNLVIQAATAIAGKNIHHEIAVRK